MFERMTASLVCDALTISLWRRGMSSDAIVHTDQGEGKMVPCFGRVLGYYYHYEPGVCHEYNVCGDLIGYYDGFPPHYGEIATLEVVENDQ